MDKRKKAKEREWNGMDKKKKTEQFINFESEYYNGRPMPGEQKHMSTYLSPLVQLCLGLD